MDIVMRVLELLLFFGLLFIVMGIVSYIITYLLMNHSYKKTAKARETQTQYLIEVDLNFSYKEWWNSKKELEDFLLSDTSNDTLAYLVRGAIAKNYAKIHFKVKEVEKKDGSTV